MPNVDLPGGTTLYTGATNSDYVPFIQTGVTVPNGRTMADGSKKILAYRIYAYAGGYGASRTVSLQLGSVKTSNFTAPAGTAVSTGWRDINALLTPGTTTFRLNASDRAYIGRSNGGSPQLEDSNGNSWSGQAVGQYSYYQAPTAPASLTESDITPNEATLDWNAPSDNGGTAITGYQIQVAKDSSFTTGLVTYNQGTTSSKALTGLSQGTTYYWRVAAKNDVTQEAGTTSVWSGTGSFTTVAQTAPTAAPTDYHLVASTATSLTVGWTAVPPASLGNLPIIAYRTEYSLNPDMSSPLVYADDALIAPLTELTPGATYYVRTAAVNIMGPGPYTAVLTVMLTGSPLAPGNFHTTAVLANSIAVAWNTPIDDGGSAITGYRLEIDTNPAFPSPTVVNVGLVNAYTFPSLTVNTTYYIRVAAKNEATAGGAPYNWSALSAKTIGVLYVRIGGVTKAHAVWVRQGGVTVAAIPHAKVGGVLNPPL